MNGESEKQHDFLYSLSWHRATLICNTFATSKCSTWWTCTQWCIGRALLVVRTISLGSWEGNTKKNKHFIWKNLLQWCILWVFFYLRGANSDQTIQRFASAAPFIANFILLVHDVLHSTRSITCFDKPWMLFLDIFRFKGPTLGPFSDLYFLS